MMTDRGTGAKVVLVVGGHPNSREIERWIIGSAGNFEVKGTMPKPVGWTASVSHDSGVYFVGNGADRSIGDLVQKAYCYSDVCGGTWIPKRLELNRMQAVAMLAPPNFADCTLATYTL